MNGRFSEQPHGPARPPRQPATPSCPTGATQLARPRAQRNLERPRERGWNKVVLGLSFEACTAVEVHSGITVYDAKAAVMRAVATWNSATLPIRIEITSNVFSADIAVDWKFTSEDPEGTLNAQTQAHADFPPGNSLFGPPPLPLHFNADFLWGIEVAGRFDVETIALHELGHCLGLIHHSGIETIMYGAIGQAPFFVRHQLDAETLARIRRLYA